MLQHEKSSFYPNNWICISILDNNTDNYVDWALMFNGSVDRTIILFILLNIHNYTVFSCEHTVYVCSKLKLATKNVPLMYTKVSKTIWISAEKSSQSQRSKCTSTCLIFVQICMYCRSSTETTHRPLHPLHQWKTWFFCGNSDYFCDSEKQFTTV